MIIKTGRIKPKKHYKPMQNLQDQFRGISLEGKAPLQKAIAIIAPIDEERKETVELLKKLVNQVGQYYGEQILEHLAKMEGKKFSSVDYNYDKQPDSQSI